MGTQGEREEEFHEDRYSDEDANVHDDDHSLLEAVLRETMGSSNREALELIFQVAKDSEFDDTSRIGAVEEVVKAILKYRFGSRIFSKRLITRIAYSLIEAPEATVKLERLWQEARSSG